MEVQETGTSYKCTFSRMYIFEIWHSLTGSETEKTRRVLEKLLEAVPNVQKVNIGNLDFRIKYINKKLMNYWKKATRVKATLVKNHLDWLSAIETIELPRGSATSESFERLGGRPKKDFTSCSKRSKRRRLAELSKIDQSAVNALMDISDHSNSSVCETRCEVNVDEVLLLITKAKLTKHQYSLLKEFINSKNSPVLPSYQKVLDAKKRCYPEERKITEFSGEFELQSLLDHTATRILDSQKEVLAIVPYESLGDVILVGKWGFDGSTGHSEYKQSFSAPGMEDGSLFVTSYVPLRLVSVSTTSKVMVLWKNPRPSSTRYCRPIRYQFTKETKNLAVQEELYSREKITKLLPTTYKVQDGEFQVNHSLQLMMVDGKICNSLSDTSSCKCYLCGATPKEMNDVDGCLEKQVDTSKLEFGLSPLHSWIRFFEYFVHLSYRLDLEKWQVRTTEDKEQMAQKKEENTK